MNTVSRGLVVVALCACFGCQNETESNTSQNAARQSRSASSAKQKLEPEEVEKTFSAYRAALLGSNGKAAADLVTDDTLKLYEKYRTFAISAHQGEINNLEISDRLSILLVRSRIEFDQLSDMDGKDLFVYAVDNGWIGKETLLEVALGKIDVKGSEATAQLVLSGQETTEAYAFRKEGKQWKVDLIPLMEKGHRLLKMMAKQEGRNENEFIFSTISLLSGKEVTEEIWIPLDESDSADR